MNKFKLLQIIHTALKSKIIVAIVASTITVGAVTTGAIIYADNKEEQKKIEVAATKENEKWTDGVEISLSDLDKQEETTQPDEAKEANSTEDTQTNQVEENQNENVKATNNEQQEEKQSSVEINPVQEQNPVQQPPVQQSPVQQPPVQQPPVQQPPVQQPPVQQPPVQQPPVQQPPVQQPPVQQPPVQQPPVQQPPVQQQNYDQVKSVPFTPAREVVDIGVSKFNYNAVSGEFVSLLDKTLLSIGETNQTQIKNVWMGKYVGGKYKVKNVAFHGTTGNFLIPQTAQEHVTVMNRYAPTYSNLRYDKYIALRINENAYYVWRLVVEFENIN